jgi:hypothetical protein
MNDKKHDTPNDLKYGNYTNRITRWEAHRINFLSLVINVILTLTGGSLIFWYSVLKDNRSFCIAGWLKISGMILAISFIVGIITMLNRLHDFRLTVEKIKKRKSLAEKRRLKKIKNEVRQVKELAAQIVTLKSEISKLELRTTKLGDRTYDFLYLQVILFAAGNLIIFMSILLGY